MNPEVLTNLSLKIKLELKPHFAADTVVECAEIRAVEIVLHISRIEVIGQVEKLDPCPQFIFFAAKSDFEVLKNLHICRKEVRKTIFRISSADKVLALVN